MFVRTLLSQFEQYVQLGKKVPAEVLSSLNSIDEPGRLVDTMAAHMALKIEQKQEILEIVDLTTRVEHVLALLDAEIDLLQVEKRIRGRVKKQMERSQREYYLNEQMKAIQKELGDGDEGHNEVEELKKRIEAAGLPKDALTKAQAELNKLKQMSPMSAEATVVRSYLDWLVQVPWKAQSKVRLDLTKPRKSSMPTTMAWKRSRNASSNTLPCRSASRRSAVRCCAWSGHPVSARPRWPSRSLPPPTQVRAHGPGWRA